MADCICGHPGSAHRHMVFDDTHPYINKGEVFVARSTGPCTQLLPATGIRCDCDHFFPLPGRLTREAP